MSDEWKPAAGLTLNLGLRYDWQTGVWNENHSQSEYPRPLPYVDFASRGDKNNVGPRVGVAWDLHKDGKSVVRAGYGLIFNNITNATNGNELTTLKQNNITINNPSYPDPYGGRDPASFASTAPPNISILNNELVNAPVSTYSAGYSQALAADLAINLGGDASAAGLGQHHVGRSRRRVDLQGAARPPREATDAPLSVHAVVHAREAGQQLRVG